MDAAPRRALPRRAPAVASAGAAAALVLVLAPANGAPLARSAAVPAPPSVPAVVLPATPVDDSAGPSPSGEPVDDKALAARVDAALRAAPLGRDVTVSVIDVASGSVLMSRGADRAQQPASTIKTLTTVTALRALGPQTRLRTTVVSGDQPGELVLVGAGDATLTRVPAPASAAPTGQSARPASLSELATRTAAALRQAGTTSVTLTVDDSLFSGPRLAPGWPSTYVTSGVVSPVSALSADSGKVSATSRARDADPALAAGRYFAARLKAAGVTVTASVARGRAPEKAPEVAAVESPTVADLVERTLTASDNDLAEALAHLAGKAAGKGGSFAGGAAAVQAMLEELGIPAPGSRIVDGSGLSRLDLVPASSITGTLLAASIDQPLVGQRAGSLWPVTSGLPIAGVSGTLTERFDTPGTSAGRGVVRAKTGTLTGVVSLAGVVRDRSGRLLVFGFVADRSPGPLLDAQAALDRAASVLAAA
ncbi:MAG: D-alanyl-D-alanine carboxypeptidase/D-alanyl-D-alanine-endopeptidase [Candidatus Nanopelagicales bacterium]